MLRSNHLDIDWIGVFLSLQCSTSTCMPLRPAARSELNCGARLTNELISVSLLLVSLLFYKR